MRGLLSVKAGRYELDDQVTLAVKASDDGTVVTIDCPLSGRRYSAAIDERGAVRWRRSEDRSVPPAAGQNAFNPNTVRAKLEPGRRTAQKASRIKFVIKWGRKYKPRNSGFVIGGYSDGRSLHVLYRVSGGFAGHDGLLCMTPDLISNGKGIPREDWLPDERWDEFLSLPDNATIHIGCPCRKMPLGELASLVGGRTIQMGPTERSG